MVKNIPFTLVAFLALALSLWIVFQTLGNSKLQQDIQSRQDRIQIIQSEIQSLQQQLQAQQQQIESANQLANQHIVTWSSSRAPSPRLFGLTFTGASGTTTTNLFLRPCP